MFRYIRKRESGGYQVRITQDGKQESFGVYPTIREALMVRDTHINVERHELTYDDLLEAHLMYTREGGGLSLYEIAERLEVPEEQIRTVYAEEKWRKHQVTDVEDEDLAVEITLASRRFARESSILHKIRRKDQEDADKWRNLQEHMGYIVEGALIRNNTMTVRAPFPIIPFPIPDQLPKYTLIVSTADLHLGKLAKQQKGFDVLQQLGNKIIDKLPGTPERIVINIGSDDFHIDNPNGATTAGTRQDVVGIPEQMMSSYFHTLVGFVELFRRLGSPVDIVLTQGNHNHWTGLAAAHYLNAFFRICSEIHVDTESKPRKYKLYYDTLVGFTHGVKMNPTKLHSLMSHEASHLWGRSNQRVWFTHHLHHEKMVEELGIKFYQLASPAGVDRWHDEMGFTTAQQGTNAYLIDDTGVFCTLFIKV